MNLCLITSWLSFNSHDYHACPVYIKSEEPDCGFFSQVHSLVLVKDTLHTDLLSANPTNSKKYCKILPGNWRCQFSMCCKDDPQSSQISHSGKENFT